MSFWAQNKHINVIVITDSKCFFYWGITDILVSGSNIFEHVASHYLTKPDLFYMTA